MNELQTNLAARDARSRYADGQHAVQAIRDNFAQRPFVWQGIACASGDPKLASPLESDARLSHTAFTHHAESGSGRKKALPNEGSSVFRLQP